MARISLERKQEIEREKELYQKSRDVFKIALTDEKIFSYGEILLNLLEQYSKTSEQKTLHISETDLIRLLGVVNEQYYLFYNKAGELAKNMSKEAIEFNKEEIINFYKKIHKNIKRISSIIINDMFHVLEEENIIRVTSHWEALSVSEAKANYDTIANQYGDKKEIFYHTPSKKYKLNEKGLNRYLEIISLIKTEMGNGIEITNQDICIQNRWDEFNFKLKKILAEEMDITTPYKVYNITFSPVQVRKKIDLMKECKTYQELYDKFKDNNNKSLDYHISVAQVWGRKALTRKLNQNKNKKLTQKEKNQIKTEAQIELEKYIQFCYKVIMLRMNKREVEEYLNRMLSDKISQDNEEHKSNIKKYQEYANKYFYDEYVDEFYNLPIEDFILGK